MKCRVCGNDVEVQHPIFQLRLREAEPQEVRIPFYRCERCRNLSCSNEMKQDFHIQRYSDNHSWSKRTKQEQERHFNIRAKKQRKLTKKISKKLGSVLSKDNYEYLEVACAEGFLLEALKKRTNWSLKGVEIDPVASAYGRELGHNILNEPYRRDLFDENSKDIISIHEALDHFNSIVDVLNDIRYHLKVDGYLSVVNTIYYWDKEQGRDKFHHSTYFTHEGLLNMFKLNGFELQYIFDLPVPRKRSHFWSKHLFIAKLAGSDLTLDMTGSHLNWRWNNKRYVR